jgi:hypothetical protein
MGKFTPNLNYSKKKAALKQGGFFVSMDWSLTLVPKSPSVLKGKVCNGVHLGFARTDKLVAVVLLNGRVGGFI